jgi:hypothetical protein
MILSSELEFNCLGGWTTPMRIDGRQIRLSEHKFAAAEIKNFKLA